MKREKKRKQQKPEEKYVIIGFVTWDINLLPIRNYFTSFHFCFL